MNIINSFCLMMGEGLEFISVVLELPSLLFKWASIFFFQASGIYEGYNNNDEENEQPNE